jgi:hypothetical protein
MAAWWAWWDADTVDMSWLAADIGAAGTVPAVLVEVVRDMQAEPSGLWAFWGMSHRRTATPKCSRRNGSAPSPLASPGPPSRRR